MNTQSSMMTRLAAISLAILLASCDGKKDDGDDDTSIDSAPDTSSDTQTDTADDDASLDIPSDDAVPDPDVAEDTADAQEDSTDLTEVGDTTSDVHDIPADTGCTTPTHSEDCSEVAYFQCGINIVCTSGVISVDWHEHLFCDDVEDIMGFACTYTCSGGCTEGPIMDWPASGAALVADHCL